GLIFIILGVGCLKPNISTMVGGMYAPKDGRRDAGFYIFYMGINLGAMLAPMVCSAVSESLGWHYGFGLAGVGMILGLVVVVRGRRLLRSPAGGRPRALGPGTRLGPIVAVAGTVPLCALLLWMDDWGRLSIQVVTVVVVGVLGGTALRSHGPTRGRVVALLVLMGFHTAFWAAFEQVGSSFTVLADAHVDRVVAGLTIPAPALQSINGMLILALAPVVSWLWRRLAARSLEPRIPTKFALGLALLGAGFLCFALGISQADPTVSLYWVVLCYLLMTIGELCLSPVGLSVVTDLAPKGMTAFCMGAWFLTYANGHLLSGWIATMTASGAETGTVAELSRYTEVFSAVGLGVLGLSGVLLMMKRWLERRIEELG
ncbi:MAG: peptide MFS transporter, partial [Myxococcales bacterium]|nr:peptide MFS transporter [Myxococcales bacterium]